LKAFLSLLAGRKGQVHKIRTSQEKRKITTPVLVLGLFLLLVVPSWRAIYRYLPFLKLAAALVYSLAVCALYSAILLFKEKTVRWPILNSSFVTIVLLVLIFSIVIFVYPQADALKSEMRGSDQDDAVIVSTQALFKGNSPYLARTYYGNIPSAGPGELLLYAPFVYLGIYQFGLPIILVVVAIMLRLSFSSWVAPNIFLLLLSSAVVFWELAAIGNDLFFVGAIILLSALLVSRDGSEGWLAFGVASVLCGLAATARVVLLFVPLVFGFGLRKRSKTKALAFSLISLFLALFLHALFKLMTPGRYQPLHLLAKVGKIFDARIMALLILACLCVVWAAFHYSKNRGIELVYALAVALGVPLFFTALGELIKVSHWDLALWEGANYSSPAAILAGAAIAVYVCRSTDLDTAKKVGKRELAGKQGFEP
jgi:hypothetical protein